MRKKIMVIFGLLVFVLITVSLSNAKVIELSAATGLPQGPPPAKAMQAYTDRIEEMSGGRVKFTFYYGGVLFNTEEYLSAMLGGVADLSDWWYSTFPETFALNMYSQLLFLGVPSVEAANAIYRDLWDKFPELREEYQGLKVLVPTAYAEPNRWLHTVDVGVTNTKQVQGMKMIGLTDELISWMQELGMSPIQIPVEDHYMSLERGLVKGEITGFARAVAHGTIELYKYHTDLGPPEFSIQPLVMNSDSWNRLPADIQAIFEGQDEWYAKMRQQMEIDAGNEAKALAEKMGQTFLKLEPGELEKWREAAKPVHRKWIERVEALGKPGQAFYDELMRLVKKYSQ